MGMRTRLALCFGIAAGWLVTMAGVWLVAPAAALICGGLVAAFACAAILAKG